MARNEDQGLYKRGQRWWLRLSVEGVGQKRVALIPAGQTKATTDKAVARLLAKRVRAELTGSATVATGTRDLQELLAEFGEAQALSGKVKSGKTAVSHCRAFLNGRTITDPAHITTAAIQAHLADLQARHDRALKTLHNVRASISAFCEFLKTPGRELLLENPAKAVKLKKTERLPARFLAEQQVAELLALVERLAREHGSDVDVAVALALWTGLRRAELARLEWTDVDLDARRLVVRKAKNKRFRAVWLNTAAIEALQQQRERTGDCKFVFPGRERRGHSGMRSHTWWIQAFKPIQARIEAFTKDMSEHATGRAWHLLRHTFASRAVQRGVSLAQIAGWLGHGDLRTTQIYAHLSPDFDEDIEKVV